MFFFRKFLRHLKQTLLFYLSKLVIKENEGQKFKTKHIRKKLRNAAWRHLFIDHEKKSWAYQKTIDYTDSHSASPLAHTGHRVPPAQKYTRTYIEIKSLSTLKIINFMEKVRYCLSLHLLKFIQIRIQIGKHWMSIPIPIQIRNKLCRSDRIRIRLQIHNSAKLVKALYYTSQEALKEYRRHFHMHNAHKVYMVAAIFPEHFQSFIVALKSGIFN